MKIAQIIVDMPLQQTNTPYDYLIPQAWEERLHPGMSVVVPFGRQNRKKQGFIVGIKEATEINPKWKTIIEYDDQIWLTPELLSIAQFLMEETCAFYIRCLQVMLPPLAKRRFKRCYQIQVENEETCTFFAKKKEWWVGKNEPTEEKQLQSWVKKGWVTIVEEEQKKGAKEKLVWFGKRLASLERLEEEQAKTRKNAVRWQEVLEMIKHLSNKDWQPLSTKIAQAQWQKAEEKGFIVRTQQAVSRLQKEEGTTSKPLSLTEEQKRAKEAILVSNQKQEHTTFLLEGVTGSGKTEVYMQVIEEVLKQGQTALLLVPEIALTSQIVQRFYARFGKKVGVLHSGLSAGEKYDEWRSIQKGEVSIVIGTRSAIFAPLEKIGVIIIDEEHESSYKQEEMPRYHAIEVAKFRAKYHHCPVVLGSATPSLESRARAEKGRYQLLRLTTRPQTQSLPSVQLLDMRTCEKHPTCFHFSLNLLNQIYYCLERKEQVILLLNRRGYASFLQCSSCGEVMQCPNCDISLTYHANDQALKCHYCGHEAPVPQECPHCHQKTMMHHGMGTQQVEEQIHQLFPSARILRMDVDTTRQKGSIQQKLKAFSEQKADILIGTQMIAKGLDFPNVTLVGVLNADTALYFPDFRASERCFQLLTQVSGRAGRGEKEGKVIIQTYNPEHYAIQCAVQQDYESFFKKEMYYRHLGNYSPYYYTVAITVKSEESHLAYKYAKIIKEQLVQQVETTTFIIGPTMEPLIRMKKQYYYQIIVKYKKEPQLLMYLKELLESLQMAEREKVYIMIDKEPLHLL
ncbi:primosomal protein N' [Catellicoccus marimammalium]|uniref:Replication restart protein PriA n=1 Tax=Catellicoccus marimammalium M35/04/3 TaxID=1234409 RepID=K8ZAD2_9ENTE|nr:primosomal protein N' [Catellicoccus marimammalium]EKU27900.1 Helicase PriA essential for oriC/DnaA-independent DNA replication [Catellicoccus marimammalium M35/04/3]